MFIGWPWVKNSEWSGKVGKNRFLNREASSSLPYGHNCSVLLKNLLLSASRAWSYREESCPPKALLLCEDTLDGRSILAYSSSKQMFDLAWLLSQLMPTPPPFNPSPTQTSLLISSFLMFFFFFNIYLFLAVLGLRCCEQTFSSCSVCGLLSSWGAWVSHCGGFFCGRAQTLDRRLQQLRCTGLVASRHVEFSQTRDQTHVLICIGRQIFNHWTTREVPSYFFLLISVETGGLALSSFCQRRRPFAYFLQTLLLSSAQWETSPGFSVHRGPSSSQAKPPTSIRQTSSSLTHGSAASQEPLLHLTVPSMTVTL